MVVEVVGVPQVHDGVPVVFAVGQLGGDDEDFAEVVAARFFEDFAELAVDGFVAAEIECEFGLKLFFLNKRN